MGKHLGLRRDLMQSDPSLPMNIAFSRIRPGPSRRTWRGSVSLRSCSPEFSGDVEEAGPKHDERPWPWYIIVCEVLAFVPFYLLYLPFGD